MLQLDKNKKYSIVELGAYDGTKTIHLLRELINLECDFEYCQLIFQLML